LSDIRTTNVTVPARITVQVNAQKVTLFYYAQPGGGTFEWWVDGAPKITVRTASSVSALKSSTISNLSSGSHLFQIRIVSAGTAGIVLDGLDARTGSPGVVVHNLGSAGSTTAGWTSVNAHLWQTQLAALHPTLVTIMLTPNDQYVLTTVSAQYSNLLNLVNRIRAAVPGAPVILIPSPDNGLHRTPAMAAYNTSQHALAASLSLGYIDILDPLNPFNPAWFNTDLIHPNATGGAMIANLILTGFKI
jgi:lysophospholipase L1-like esterase